MSWKRPVHSRRGISPTMNSLNSFTLPSSPPSTYSALSNPIRFYRTSVDFDMAAVLGTPTSEDPYYHELASSMLTAAEKNHAQETPPASPRQKQQWKLDPDSTSSDSSCDEGPMPDPRPKMTLESFAAETEKGAFSDEILGFIEPFFSDLAQRMDEVETQVEKSDGKLSPIDIAVEWLRVYSYDKRVELESLMQTMNVKKLIVPYVELDLPAEVILRYNELEDDAPQIMLYQLNPILAPGIRELSVFLDRHDTNKEVMCLLLWSSSDSVLINLPCVGLNPYPLCWKCSKNFGLSSCGKCQTAKYCSKECQTEHWSQHKLGCDEMEEFIHKHRHLTLSCPPCHPTLPLSGEGN